PNVSRAMQYLNGTYAQWWNKKHDRVGHVFQGRFKDQIVQREGYFLTLCRYIALNPVRAQLAQQPDEWPWSSYRQILGLAPCPPFLVAEQVLGQFGEDHADVLRARYAEYVLENGEARDLAIVDRIRSKERILGDKQFKESVRSEAAVLPPLQQVIGSTEAAVI
ncbi:MAG TPA: hypothetical protein VLV48_07145, partial [Thermoanaerobaculia bacterium]|nr:hypothetical protein [Thermoanaerobaculia bacterium]